MVKNGCDTNYASTRKEILNGNIGEVSDNTGNKFSVYRFPKVENDGYLNIKQSKRKSGGDGCEKYWP